MSEVERLDLDIYRGETYTLQFHLEDDNGVPVDLTGYAFLMQGRDCAEGPSLFQFGTSGSGISVSGSACSLTVTAAQTAALEFYRADYDMRMTKPDTTVEYITQGEVKVHQRVTR